MSAIREDQRFDDSAEAKALLVEEVLKQLREDSDEGIRSLLYVLLEEDGASLTLCEYVEPEPEENDERDALFVVDPDLDPENEDVF